MTIGWESDQRITIRADPKIFRSMVRNLDQVHEEGKYHASFWSDISKDHQINMDLIVWISSSKSNRRLSLEPEPNIYKPMAYNPYQICEPSKRGTCWRGDNVRDRRILRDLDWRDIKFQHGRRLFPRTDSKFYTLTVYLPCQLCKAGKDRAYLWSNLFHDQWITWGSYRMVIRLDNGRSFIRKIKV